MSRQGFREFIATNLGSLPPPPARPMSLPPVGGSVPPPPVSPGSGYVGPVAPPPPSQSQALPDFMSAANIRLETVQTPPLLINDLLHRGCKLMLSGGSKSFKSWVLYHLGLCVATGQPWWGLPCAKGRVLVLNFELIGGFFEHRILSICRAIGVSPPADFMYWNLRGHCYDLDVLAKTILARLAQSGPIDLIIVDPIYKALGDLDENSASDMTKLMNLIETITVQTGAAVAFGSHFSKGNQASKEAKDRPSGSGVLIRDPDAILVLTRHQQDHCYVVSSELRYLPPMGEFVVRWNFPIMQADESLDPRELYDPTKREGEKPAAAASGGLPFSENDVLACLPDAGAQDSLWRKMVAMKFGRTGNEYYAIKGSLLQKGLVTKLGQKYFRANVSLQSQ